MNKKTIVGYACCFLAGILVACSILTTIMKNTCKKEIEAALAPQFKAKGSPFRVEYAGMGFSIGTLVVLKYNVVIEHDLNYILYTWDIRNGYSYRMHPELEQQFPETTQPANPADREDAAADL